MNVPRVAQAPLDWRHCSPLGRLLQAAVVSSAALLLLLAVLLSWRRISGFLVTPLNTLLLLGVVLVLVAASGALRLLWFQIRAGAPQGVPHRWLHVSITLAVVLIALALMVPGTSVASQVLSWLMLGATEAGWWLVSAGRWPPWTGRNDRGTALSAPEQPATPANVVDEVHAADEVHADDGESPEQESAEDAPILPAEVSQQLTRARQPAGGEVVFGLLRADFAPRQRTQSLHVAFCPPLQATPTLDFTQVDGPAVSIAPGELQSYGVRLDLRLSRMSRRSQSVVVHFDAREPAGTAAD